MASVYWLLKMVLSVLQCQLSTGDTKKLFSIVNSLCKVDNRYDTLPPHHSFQILADDFGAFFIKKIELIQEDIDNIVVNQPELDSHHLHTE